MTEIIIDPAATDFMAIVKQMREVIGAALRRPDEIVDLLIAKLEGACSEEWASEAVKTLLTIGFTGARGRNDLIRRVMALGRRNMGDMHLPWRLLSMSSCASAMKPPDYDQSFALLEEAYREAERLGHSRRCCLHGIASEAVYARDWRRLEDALRRLLALGPRRIGEFDDRPFAYFLKEVPADVIDADLRARFITMVEAAEKPRLFPTRPVEERTVSFAGFPDAPLFNEDLNVARDYIFELYRRERDEAWRAVISFLERTLDVPVGQAWRLAAFRELLSHYRLAFREARDPAILDKGLALAAVWEEEEEGGSAPILARAELVTQQGEAAAPALTELHRRALERLAGESEDALIWCHERFVYQFRDIGDWPDVIRLLDAMAAFAPLPLWTRNRMRHLIGEAPAGMVPDRVARLFAPRPEDPGERRSPGGTR
ncbi:MAG: hypothetical protein RLO50_00560 [Azospirillaceae bacterium]